MAWTPAEQPSTILLMGGSYDDDAEKTVESVPGWKCFLGFGFLLAIGNQGRYSIHDERNEVISDPK